MVQKAHEPPSNYFEYEVTVMCNDEEAEIDGINCSEELMGVFLDFIAYTEEE